VNEKQFVHATVQLEAFEFRASSFASLAKAESARQIQKVQTVTRKKSDESSNLRN